eukprot:GHUV01055335.1.p1 GENE.GHUV01055335.1~~GHUV01055335.1.p1  ORF type:complete len:107 (-),score=5.64 GHUV01055335.1:180-500(-)
MGVMSAFTVLQMKHSRSMNFNSSGSLMYLRATSPTHTTATAQRHAWGPLQGGSTVFGFDHWGHFGVHCAPNATFPVGTLQQFRILDVLASCTACSTRVQRVLHRPP